MPHLRFRLAKESTDDTGRCPRISAIKYSSSSRSQHLAAASASCEDCAIALLQLKDVWPAGIAPVPCSSHEKWVCDRGGGRGDTPQPPPLLDNLWPSSSPFAAAVLDPRTPELQLKGVWPSGVGPSHAHENTVWLRGMWEYMSRLHNQHLLTSRHQHSTPWRRKPEPRKEFYPRSVKQAGSTSFACRLAPSLRLGSTPPPLLANAMFVP